MSKIIGAITYDKFAGSLPRDPDYSTRVGTQFDYDSVLSVFNMGELDPSEVEWEDDRTMFRLYDDDDELYYGGWLLNDGECIAQQVILKWGEADAGCTTIVIRQDYQWIQEIG